MQFFNPDMAVNDKVGLSLEIAIVSSLQIALFVAPEVKATAKEQNLTCPQQVLPFKDSRDCQIDQIER